jgi:hypothetical protein
MERNGYLPIKLAYFVTILTAAQAMAADGKEDGLDDRAEILTNMTIASSSTLNG